MYTKLGMFLVPIFALLHEQSCQLWKLIKLF